MKKRVVKKPKKAVVKAKSKKVSKVHSKKRVVKAKTKLKKLCKKHPNIPQCADTEALNEWIINHLPII